MGVVEVGATDWGCSGFVVWSYSFHTTHRRNSDCRPQHMQTRSAAPNLTSGWRIPEPP